MTYSRRDFALASMAGLSNVLAIRPSHSEMQQTTVLRISHQFPAGTIDSGDFRDRLCRKFAREVTQRSGGALTFRIYPGASLMKTNAQIHALRVGALDMSLFPLSSAGGEIPELNIAAMPGTVTSYEQGIAWKHSAIGRALSALLLKRGLLIVSWIWQAGAVVSKSSKILDPTDVRGVKVRGGSRSMDLMLQTAGATVVALPSNELYVAMQTGVVDATISTATSLISFRLQEISRSLTTSRAGSFWYVLVPLLISRVVFERLPIDQQSILMQVGGELELFGAHEARADDARIVDVYSHAGVRAFDLNPAMLAKWRTAACKSAWERYTQTSASCANLLRLARQVHP